MSLDYTQKKFRPRGFMNAVLNGQVKPESQAVHIPKDPLPMDKEEIAKAKDAGLVVKGQYCETLTKV